MGPTNVTVDQNTIAHFECHFNALTQDFLTIVEWLKDDGDITNTSSSKYLITRRVESEQTNVIFAELNIFNVSRSDQGSYSCKCYYNSTVLNRYHIYTPVIAEGLATLQLKGQGEQGMCMQVQIIVILVIQLFIIL